MALRCPGERLPAVRPHQRAALRDRGPGLDARPLARTSETIAQQRTIDLANLSQINELVIRDMQDGMLVVDPEGTIRQHNPRAAQLLGPLPAGRRPLLAESSPAIARIMESWRRGPETTFLQFRSPRSDSELAVHFVAIGSGEPPPTVIFVEDVGRLRAQAQQMKLVALGRLTASIAHAIRNPLFLGQRWIGVGFDFGRHSRRVLRKPWARDVRPLGLRGSVAAHFPMVDAAEPCGYGACPDSQVAAGVPAR